MIETEERAQDEAPRRRRGRRIALALGVLFSVALVIVWTQRKPIAGDFIASELEKRGVAGSYRVAQIGFRTQRLENIVIGDRARPDLTAQWAEVSVRLGLSGAEVTGIRAGGVRLRGRLVDGTVSFGAIDKLLPEPSGKPFALPDLELDLRDARMRLDLPWGPVGMKLEGRGNLTNGFSGKLAAVAPRLAFGNCPVEGGTAWLDLSVSNRAPSVKGPVRAARVACPGFALTSPQAQVNATLSEALDRWKGDLRLELANATYGANRLGAVRGKIGFDGTSARTGGQLKIAAADATTQTGRARELALEGAYRLGSTPAGMEIALGGKASAGRMSLDRRLLSGISTDAATGTPVGPLVQALAGAVQRAGSNLALSADFTAAQRGSAGSLQVNSIDARSASGARLAMAGALKFAWPLGARQMNGRLTLAGGGFPDADVNLSQPQPGAPINGTARIAPYAAGGARLALGPVRFTDSRFDTSVTLDGPLPDGHVKVLRLPVSGRIDARGGIAVNPGCAPLRFEALKLSSLSVGGTSLTLCPAEGPALFALSPSGRMSGGARITSPRLAGRMGSTPIALAAADARYALGSGVLAANALAIRLGTPDRLTRLDIASLDGRIARGILSGNFAGLGGQIADVPLIASEAAGQWRFANGGLGVTGGLRVSDDAPEPRFHPLISDDFKLDLVNSRITALGTLKTPDTRIPVTSVSIAHDLSAGSGKAVLDVSGLTFGPKLQPEALTRLALGVVANVEGSVNGRGEIRWSPQGVSSDGVFRTSGANLAAAFGPVSNLSGEIRFTDLLGLTTAPGQTLTIGEVNPGIAVTNGTLRYQLLPESRVAIEGGEWPFANGRLILEPTVLDLGAERARNLTFRVEGVDAAAFLQQFDFENINATGTFDGTLPIVFDQEGGRIVGGHLRVRESGGRIAYVGELTEKDLGAWGNVAFQALRSIEYRSLEIIMNGDLAGEMITQVRFAGLSQGEGAKRNFLTDKIAALPIRFNVTIRAPFRQLLFSARSIYDPSLLIEQNLPALIEEQKRRENPVQPAESETKP